MNYGVWITSPGHYTGWFGLASGDIFRPWAFAHRQDAEKMVEHYRKYYSTEAEVRDDPPLELPWTQEVWEKSRA